MSTFLSYSYLNIDLVEFDTEDNIFRTLKTHWEQNLDLNTWEPLSTYGFRRYSNDRAWFKSINEIKSIRLNKFDFNYKIKKVSPFHFEIKSDHFREYFDGTDNIEIVVKY
jgi:hypothetical protein